MNRVYMCWGRHRFVWATLQKRRHSRPDDTPPRDERQAKRRRNKMSKTMTNSSSCYSLLACVIAVWRGRRAHPRVIPADTGRDSRQPLRGPSIRSAANSSDCERRKPIRGEVRCRQGGGAAQNTAVYQGSSEIKLYMFFILYAREHANTALLPR